MSNELTPFGQWIRKFRIDTNESQRAMAEKLGYNGSGYLSQVERGTKVFGSDRKVRVSLDLVHRIEGAYQLTQKQKQELKSFL
jgi:transcriptional regulator with XRE-family HTH domain